MMTKYTKTIAIVCTLFLVGLFISATFFIQTKTAKISDSYNARKEEILASQQKLELLIIDLNKTLETAMARERILSKQLASLENQSSGVSSPPVISPPVPTPTPTPKPPVTRAS